MNKAVLTCLALAFVMAFPPAKAFAMDAASTASPLTPSDETAPAHDNMSPAEDAVAGAHGAEEGIESEGHHASAGLPQMDTKWFPSQVFWLALTFLGLYVVFGKKLLPEISGTLENRRSHIQGDLDSAQDLREEVEKVQQANEEALDEARASATQIFVEVQESLKRKTQKKMDSFAATSQKKTKEVEVSIEEEKTKAMIEMQTIAAEIASAAAEKIIGVSTDIDQARTLVKNIGRKAA